MFVTSGLRALVPAMFVLPAFATPPIDATLFSNPSFADAPYHSIVSAQGGREKLLMSYQGPGRRVYAAAVANGFARHSGLGESFVVTRTAEPSDVHAPTPETQYAVYDNEFSAPVHFFRADYSDGIRMEFRTMGIDDGSETENGFLMNVSAISTSSNPKVLHVAAFVDLLENVQGLQKGPGDVPPRLQSAFQKTLLCSYLEESYSSRVMVENASGRGHASKSILVPLLAGTDKDKPDWARTLALARPYPGQQEVPGGNIDQLLYQIPCGTSTLGNSFYLAVGVGEAPGLASSVQILAEGRNATQLLAGNNISYLRVRDMNMDGAINISIAQGGHVAALWLYSISGVIQGSTDEHMQSRPPSDLGQLLSFLDAGSGDDTSYDGALLLHSFTLDAGKSLSFLMHIPPGNASSQGSSCASDPELLWQRTEDIWMQRLASLPHFEIPSFRMKRALTVETQQLMMMTERQVDGLRVLKGPIHYYGSDPYDTFRVTGAFQRLGLFNLSRRVLTRQLSQRCKNGMWQMWEISPPPTKPGLYIVQGLASKAIYDHWLATRDPAWLRQALPSLNSTAWATIEERRKCNCSGLLPVAGGDGGLPIGHIYVQEVGALFGIRIAADAAAQAGYESLASALEAEFESFRASLLETVNANMLAAEHWDQILPLFPGNSPANLACCVWGAVDIVYPFPLFFSNSSTVEQSVQFWSSPNRTGKYGLHLGLGYSKHEWAYMSADIGHIHLQQGNFSGAWRVLEAMVNSSSPVVSTFEEYETGPLPKTMWGGIPDMWFTAEVVNLLRDCLVLEHLHNSTLSILHAIPPKWHDARRMALLNMPTQFGCRASVSLQYTSGRRILAFRLASDSGLENGPAVIRFHLGESAHCEVQITSVVGLPERKEECLEPVWNVSSSTIGKGCVVELQVPNIKRMGPIGCLEVGMSMALDQQITI